MKIKDLMMINAEMYRCYKCGEEIESYGDLYCKKCYIIIAKEYRNCMARQTGGKSLLSLIMLEED